MYIIIIILRNSVWYGDGAVTQLSRTLSNLPNLNVLAAVSNGMLAVKLVQQNTLLLNAG